MELHALDTYALNLILNLIFRRVETMTKIYKKNIMRTFAKYSSELQDGSTEKVNKMSFSVRNRIKMNCSQIS
jgi:hypothetical protein